MSTTKPRRAKPKRKTPERGPRECPACKSRTLRRTKTEYAGEARIRRYSCSECGHTCKTIESPPA